MFLNYNFFPLIIVCIFQVMFTMKTARPSQENRDIIKQMVIDWYRKSSPKRDFDLQNLLTETDGKLGSVMFPPNGFLNTPSKDPFSWVEWGRQPGKHSDSEFLG